MKKIAAKAIVAACSSDLVDGAVGQPWQEDLFEYILILIASCYY